MLLAAVLCCSTVFALTGTEQTDIVVNDVALSADTVRALQQVYPVAIAPGRYWILFNGLGGYEDDGGSGGKSAPARTIWASAA